MMFIHRRSQAHQQCRYMYMFLQLCVLWKITVLHDIMPWVNSIPIIETLPCGTLGAILLLSALWVHPLLHELQIPTITVCHSRNGLPPMTIQALLILLLTGCLPLQPASGATLGSPVVRLVVATLLDPRSISSARTVIFQVYVWK